MKSIRKREKRDQRKVRKAVEAVAAVAPRQSGILVVENDPDLQWRLARMLTVQGNRVVGTSSGDGALALISQWPVDLVLVEEELPGMDGLELARRIRETHQEIPVILMTDRDGSDFQMAARLAGAVATLAKPFRFEALIELLETLKLGPLAPLPAAE